MGGKNLVTATDSEADYWPQILFIPRLLFCQKFALKTNFLFINAQGTFLFFYSDPWHTSQRTGISATEHTGGIQKLYLLYLSHSQYFWTLTTQSTQRQI